MTSRKKLEEAGFTSVKAEPVRDDTGRADAGEVISVDPDEGHRPRSTRTSWSATPGAAAMPANRPSPARNRPRHLIPSRRLAPTEPTKTEEPTDEPEPSTSAEPSKTPEPTKSAKSSGSPRSGKLPKPHQDPDQLGRPLTLPPRSPPDGDRNRLGRDGCNWRACGRGPGRGSRPSADERWFGAVETSSPPPRYQELSSSSLRHRHRIDA